MKATIDEGWHLYSQYINNKIGPVPTAFVFTPTEKVKLIGKTEEPTPIKEYDKQITGPYFFAKIPNTKAPRGRVTKEVAKMLYAHIS